ncbi:NADPH oxidase 5-like isoform X2 [Babylonia areolata]
MAVPQGRLNKAFHDDPHSKIEIVGFKNLQGVAAEGRRETALTLAAEDLSSASGMQNGQDVSIHQDVGSKPPSASLSREDDKAVNAGGAKSNREDEKTYAQIEKQFRAVAGPSGSLDRDTFRKALHVKKSYFAERLFELFDDDNSGSIDLNELLQGLKTLTKGTPSEKLHFLFRIYDADNSGTISREELRTVLQSCMEESSLHLSQENLEALTDVLFHDADTDRSGSITFEELRSQLEKHPGVMNNLTISVAQWLTPPTQARSSVSIPRHLTLTYFQNNRVKVFFTLFFVLVNIALYIINAWLYRESNWYIIIARGGGMCLNFNCAFVLVLMLRKSLTFLRNTPLVRVLPFDQHVMFHKLAGYAIVFFTLVHTGAHLGNAAVYLTESTHLNVAQILFTLRAGVGWIDGFAPLSGVILDLILLVMFICSMDFVRRSGNFEVFYWTHKLYVPFYILNILHGANFWKWIVGPAVIFCVELLFRLQCFRHARYGRMYIECVHLLPSGVTELWISRPNSFQFKAGDYVFLNIPVIAHYEWHPLTISSAPETKGSFSVHIRSAGHWTRKLYAYFEDIIANRSDPEANGSSPCGKGKHDELSFRRRNSKAKKINENRMKRVRSVTVHLEVFVDGPYGTPSRHIFQAEHAVLIGSGIGVTPFASILQSIVCRFREAEVTCPKCSHLFATQLPKSVMALKKVDFIWINRDQRNFEWFLSLLTKLEREQSRDCGLGHVLDMQMYMTSALTKQDMKGIGLQMALDLIHAHEQTDLVTGLQTRTQPGRPDFDKVFSEIYRNSNYRIKVFFCGAPVLGRAIKAACVRHGFAFSQENF